MFLMLWGAMILSFIGLMLANNFKWIGLHSILLVTIYIFMLFV